MIVTVAGVHRTERVALNLTDAPGMDLSGAGDVHTPTGAELTYRSTTEGPGQSDVTLLFGKIGGHYPTVTYWAVTEARRPRPDWVGRLIRDHAPDWWGQP